MKHFTILENQADSESPMIGTINNVSDDTIGAQSFKNRLITALEEHFDTLNIRFEDKIPDMFEGQAYEDLAVYVDEIVYEIRIMETWIY